jgi:hypothetical protein
MANKSMNFLRKNARTVLVFMGVVCMVTFVVGPYLLDLLGGRGRPGNDNPVVVTWAKGKVRSDELQRMRFYHQLAYQFLQQVVVTAIQRGGKPTLYGQPIRLDQSFDVGIPADNSDEVLVQTMVLAEEAHRRGIVVDRSAVKEFLRQLSFPELNEGDWQEIAQELVRDKHVTVNQLFDQLAYELQAQRMRVLAMTGLTAPRVGPIVPPGQAWELFNRLNRRVTIEAYPIDVLPLVSQVREEPSEAEIQALFEQGRYRDPNPSLDEPAFHKPHKLAFTYLKVPFARFLEEAKQQITDEQIQQTYQEDISQGRHKVLELPPEKPPAGQAPAATPPTDKPADDKPADDKPADGKPADGKPAADKPADDKPSTQPTPSNTTDAEKPAEKPTEQPSDKPPATAPNRPADKPASGDKPAGEPAPPAASDPGAPGTDKAPKPEEKSSNKSAGAAESPSCGGDDDPLASAPQSDAPPTKAAPSSSALQPTHPAPSGDQEAEKSQKTGENASAVNQPTTEKADKAEKPAEKPGESKPAPAEAAASSPPASAPADKPAEPSPKGEGAPKFKPLSEVREEILLRLARPIAEEARKKAVAEVMSAIEAYGKKYRRYRDVKSVRKTADIPDPGQLDLAPLAAKYGFEIGTTPLVDRFEVTEYEIGQKVQQLDMAAVRLGQFRMLSFADLAFGTDEPLYRPQEVPSVEAEISYIYFRTAEEKPANVTLAEARPQVVAFWKKRRAFELAQAEARKLIEKLKAQGEGASLATVVPDPSRVVVTPPFSWMTTPHFGFGMPELSPVPGIELAGQQFMQAVFALQPGQTGLAPNQSHTKVYVVRVLGQEPDEETLRQRFLESGYNNFVLMLAQLEARQAAIGWYRGLEDRYQVKWVRPPQEVQRL